MATTTTSTSDNAGAPRNNESRSATVYSHRPMQPAVVTARTHTSSHPNSHHTNSHTPTQISIATPSPTKGGSYTTRAPSPVNNASSSTARPPRIETPPSLRVSLASIRADYVALAEEVATVRAARDDLANRFQEQSVELAEVKRALNALERTHYSTIGEYGGHRNTHAGREIELDDRNGGPYSRTRDSRTTMRERVPSGRDMDGREGAGRGGRSGHDEPGGYPRDRAEPDNYRTEGQGREQDARGGGRGGRQVDEGRDSRYNESDYEMRAALSYLPQQQHRSGAASSSAGPAHPQSPQTARDSYFGQDTQRPLYTSTPHPTSEHSQHPPHPSQSPYTHHPHASGHTTPRGPHPISREPSSINTGMAGPPSYSSHTGPGNPGPVGYTSRRPYEDDYEDEGSVNVAADRNGRASKRHKGRRDRAPSPSVRANGAETSGSSSRNTSSNSIGPSMGSVSTSTSATSAHLSPHPGHPHAAHQGRSRSHPPSPIVPGAEFAHLNMHTVPPGFAKEGDDWHAVFDPRGGVYSPAPPSPLGSGSGQRSPASGASGARGTLRRTMDVNLNLTIQHQSVVCSVQFSGDGRYLATGCNRTTQIYDVTTGAQVCVLEDLNASKSGKDLYIRSIRFSPDSMLLATGAEDCKIRIWDLSSRTIRRVLTGHEQEIYAIDFAPHDGRHIASGSGDKTLRLWDLATEACMVITVDSKGSTVTHTRPGSPPRTTPRLHRGPDGTDAHAYDTTTSEGASVLDTGVTSVAFSPDGSFVAAGSLDWNVRVWSVADGTLLRVLRGHSDSVYSIGWTPNGRSIVSGSLDCIAKLWDWDWDAADSRLSVATREKGRAPLNFSSHKDYVLSVCVSHDGRYVLSGSKDRCVHVWDAHTGALQFGLQGHKNSVISLAVNPLGGMFATGSGDSTTRIWTYSAIA